MHLYMRAELTSIMLISSSQDEDSTPDSYSRVRLTAKAIVCCKSIDGEPEQFVVDELRWLPDQRLGMFGDIDLEALDVQQ